MGNVCQGGERYGNYIEQQEAHDKIEHYIYYTDHYCVFTDNGSFYVSNEDGHCDYCMDAYVVSF